MTKKILITLFILFIAGTLFMNVVSRKAPAILKNAIQKALNKEIAVTKIEYYFPLRFKLDGFEIKEKSPFLGETSFHVDHVNINLSLMSLLKKSLEIDDFEVENALIILRKKDQSLFHSLSSATADEPPNHSTTTHSKKLDHSSRIPLIIHRLKIKNSQFRFVDYDVDQNGFALNFNNIQATVEDIQLPFSPNQTHYRIQAALAQGRDQRPADFKISGETNFENLDTEGTFAIRGVHLPYFRSYYSQVTGAVIGEGFLDSKAVFKIRDKRLSANLDFELRALFFESYELENELFGLKADEILSFLKDSSGKLKFQFALDWNMASRSPKLHEVIRKNIEYSLKATVLGNVGGLIQKALQKIPDTNPNSNDDKVEETIKKIKDFLKY